MSKNYASKVVKVAEKEVGYLEKKSNSQLESKTANAGFGNWTKYANYFDTKHPDFYNGKKNGFDWCDMFVDWCFVTAYGYEAGRKLLCQPLHSTGAGCPYSAQFYKNNGQFHSRLTTPKAGDQIFFIDGGEPCHTGIVYKVDNTFVYTIEGNTSSAAGVVANGGCVAKKKYYLGSSYIYGYGRPKFDKEPKANIKFKVKGGLYKKDFKDLVGGASKPAKTLVAGSKVEWVSDDKFGWSKVKYGGKTYYVLNANLDKKGLSSFKVVALTKKTEGFKIAPGNKRGKNITLARTTKVKVICTITEGKYKGWSYAKDLKGTKYYLKAKLI